MCNINYLWHRNGISKRDVAMLEAVTYNSWLGNDDGEGYLLSDGSVTKSLVKLFPVKEQKMLGKKWTIWHERRISHGLANVENTQPIETDRIVLLHNGVMQIDGAKDKSDSWHFAQKITGMMNEGKDLFEAFKICVKEVEGSKSIFVFDKRAKKLYYFKNAQTSFYVCGKGELVFASTDQQNADYVAQLIGAKPASEVIANTIYEINSDGDWKAKWKFVPKKQIFKFNWGKKEEKVEDTIETNAVPAGRICDVCCAETNYLTTREDGMKVCIECWHYFENQRTTAEADMMRDMK